MMVCALVSASANAEECIFNEAVYTDFINTYAAEHKQASIVADARTLSVSRDQENIKMVGGGCDHLGASIEYTSNQTLNEQLFLQKVLRLSKEFGGWLMYGDALEQAIKTEKYETIDGEYYFNLDAMTVLSASYEIKGNINIDFYIH